MCQSCRDRISQINERLLTAIEAHRGELIEIAIETMKYANPEVVKARKAMEKAGHELISEEDQASQLLLLMAAIIAGQSARGMKKIVTHMAYIAKEGIADGWAMHCAKGLG